MINIGGNPLMILLAIVAALGGVGLYFVRSFKPQLARDHDIFFSAIALVYGIILLAFNFRMEITTQLAQVLVVSFAGWFAIESLTLRQLVADQARQTGRSSPGLEPDLGPGGDDFGGYDAGGYTDRGSQRYGRYEPDADLRAELDSDRVPSPRRSIGVSRRMRGIPEDVPAELGDGRTGRRARRFRTADDRFAEDGERGTPEAGWEETEDVLAAGFAEGTKGFDNVNDTVRDTVNDNVIEIDDRDIQPLERRSRTRSREGRSREGRSSRRRRRESPEGL
ncbi:MAG: Ycf66 family protein [Pseudanabaenaceae cyanobacterium]